MSDRKWRAQWLVAAGWMGLLCEDALKLGSIARTLQRLADEAGAVAVW